MGRFASATVTFTDKTLIAQVNEQQYEYLLPKTAQEWIHLKFWHPRDRHDDQLMSSDAGMPSSLASAHAWGWRFYAAKLKLA